MTAKRLQASAARRRPQRSTLLSARTLRQHVAPQRIPEDLLRNPIGGLIALMQELGAALGAGFRLDRELAPGGMSQVFIAHDLTLARDVVVKVLAGDVSGVSTDRFRQEIQLMARLQHPQFNPGVPRIIRAAR